MIVILSNLVSALVFSLVLPVAHANSETIAPAAPVKAPPGFSSEGPELPRPKELNTVQDVAKARQLVISEMLNDVADHGGVLGTAIWQSQEAKSRDDVSLAFAQAYGFPQGKVQADQFEKLMINALKDAGSVPIPGASLASAAGHGLELMTQVREFIRANGDVKTTDLPSPDLAVTNYYVIKNLPTELQDQVVQEYCRVKGVKFDDYVTRVRGNRILTSDEVTPTDYSPEIAASFNKRLDQINTELLTETKLLSQIATNQGLEAAKAQKDAEIRKRQDELKEQVEHQKAIVFLGDVLLGPLLKGRAAEQFATTGNSLIQMNEALQKYGPTGIVRPDNLLLMTNFASAGIAIAQAFIAPPEDPTKKMLEEVLHQLQAIQKQLARIENKIDNLTDLVLSGFEKVLKEITYEKERITQLIGLIEGIEKDNSQSRVIQDLQQYLEADRATYGIGETCNDVKNFTSERSCFFKFAEQLATTTLGTNQGQSREAEIFNSVFNNKTLPHRIPDSGNGQLVLEQLSYPMYFADSPLNFGAVIARNHEAVMAYAAQVLGISRGPNVLANPDVLWSRLHTLVQAIKLHPDLGGESDLLAEAIARINELEMSIAALTAASSLAKLDEVIAKDLRRYEEDVRKIAKDALDNPFAAARASFLSNGSMQRCDYLGPVLDVPARDQQGYSTDKLVPEYYWIAQDLGLGTLGQCYDVRQDPNSVLADPHGGYLRNIFTIKIFFNPTPAGLSKSDPNNTHLTPTSQIIVMRQLETKLHYTHAGGGYADTEDALSWVSRGWAPNDIAECDNTYGGGFGGWRRRLPDYGSIPPLTCITGVIYVPRDQFLADSANILDNATAAKGLKDIKHQVRKIWGDVIYSRSQPWVAPDMSADVKTPPQNMTGSPVMEQSFLHDDLKAYTQKLLFGENLFLTSMFHQNPVSQCVDQLEAYSPRIVTNKAIERMTDDKPSIADEFERGFQSVLPYCNGHQIKPELAKIKAKLVSIRDGSSN